MYLDQLPSSQNKIIVGGIMFSNYSFTEANEELVQMVETSKKFEGFYIKGNLVEEVSSAADCLELGEEREAVKLLQEVTRGIKNTLLGFFRGSPKHFVNLFNALRTEFGELDQDIEQKVQRTLDEEAKVAGGQLEIDFELAAEVYVKAFEILRWAEKEQRARVENRKKRSALKRVEENRAKEAMKALEVAKALEEARAREEERKRIIAKHAAEQRALEAEKRKKKADILRNLASTLR